MEGESGDGDRIVKLANDSASDEQRDELPQRIDADVVVEDASIANEQHSSIEPGASCRVQLQNLPRYMGHKQIKTFLAKNLNDSSLRKIRMFSDTVYFSLASPEDAEKAVDALNGFEMKGRKISAKICAPEPPKGRDIPRSALDAPSNRSAREIVTPLSDIDYSDQLDSKMSDAKRLATSLVRNMISANVKDARAINASKLVQPIRYSPQTTGYRNKCEFTVGHDLEGNVCVGFVGGRFSANMHYILPIDTCTNISERMKGVVNDFQKFVIDSGEETFNEFERIGLWKMLTVREFTDDIMIIVTVFPIGDKEKEEKLKKALTERFLKKENLSAEENKLKVTSIYWQTLANASDPLVYEHVAGSRYIYETILGTRFRVSPGAFFQTNSCGAAVLYSTIAEKANLLSAGEDDRSKEVAGSSEDPNMLCRIDESEGSKEVADNVGTKVDDSCADSEEKVKEANEACGQESAPTNKQLFITSLQESKKSSNEMTADPEDMCADREEMQLGERHEEGSEGVESKKRKFDGECDGVMKCSENQDSLPNTTIILDVCCGTGTIGLCLMSLLRGSKTAGRRYLLGVEMVPEAIEDAKSNALDNAFTPDECRFVAGKAEDIFRGLRFYMPSSIKLDEASVVGILDPPRAGIHEKVVFGCRMLSSLRRLIFICCEPSLALKNIVDLCRPRSKKYDGQPFTVTSITPVDMFPQTKHCEWVVQLDR